MSESILSVEDLRVAFPTADGLVQAVNGVSFELRRGKTLAIVGESGSGKSVTAQSIMGLINRRTAQITGRVAFEGQDIVAMPDKQLHRLRGAKMSMIFQDPMSSLHPYYRIGAQLIEAVRVHQQVSRAQARQQAIELLRQVGIPAAERRVDDYPHQLSGGMRQRVMIAMALINSPTLLIADEPTTALDVTVQASILDLIGQIQREDGMAMVLITHDFGVVAEVADEVAVMYAGRVVETGPVSEVIRAPLHPYTEGLLRATRLPAARTPGGRLEEIAGVVPLLRGPDPGCSFRDRCPLANAACAQSRPLLSPARGSQQVACFVRSPQ